MEYKKVPHALFGSTALWNMQGHGFIRQLSLVISCQIDLFLKLLPELSNVFVSLVVTLDLESMEDISSAKFKSCE
jgi:hypothetical protein